MPHENVSKLCLRNSTILITCKRGKQETWRKETVKEWRNCDTEAASSPEPVAAPALSGLFALKAAATNHWELCAAPPEPPANIHTFISQYCWKAEIQTGSDTFTIIIIIITELKSGISYPFTSNCYFKGQWVLCWMINCHHGEMTWKQPK